MSKLINVTVEETKELIQLEGFNSSKLFVKDGTDHILAVIREKVSHIVPDLNTKKGRDEITKLAYSVTRTKTTLDKMGKTLADKYNAMIKPINSERKKVRDELDKLKVEIKQPLIDWEIKENDRISRIDQSIEDIKKYAYSISGCEPEHIKTKIDELNKINITEEFYQEFFNNALFQREYSLKVLKEELPLAEKLKSDREELDALRKEKEIRDKKERELEEQKRLKELQDKKEREIEEEKRLNELQYKTHELSTDFTIRPFNRKEDIPIIDMSGLPDQEKITKETEKLIKEDFEEEDIGIIKIAKEHTVNALIENGIPEQYALKLFSLIQYNLLPYLSFNPYKLEDIK